LERGKREKDREKKRREKGRKEIESRMKRE
jgi:hypothetical protein